MPNVIIRIQDLSKYYGHKQGTVVALEDVSFQVESGAFKIIQGPSGSGKTTILLSVGGLLSPDEGKILVKDKDIYHLSAEERASFRAENIGFVFQQFYLVNYLTVMENVMLPDLAIKFDGIEKRAKELLTALKLDHRLDHQPSELSTGERQRVALARALVLKPQVLLADEPTGNLDEENEKIILDYFKEFTNKDGAVLMVTHSSRIEKADEVIQLKNGRIT